MVFGFLRKLKDGIVNVGKGILGGAKNFVGNLLGGAKEKVKEVATRIQRPFFTRKNKFIYSSFSLI